MIHHIMPVCHGGGEAEVLLHQQHRETALLDLADGAADLLHDHRRQALGGFIEQQQLGPGTQDAPDCQHLLLAAGEFGALTGRAFLEVGEQRVDFFHRQPAGRRDRGQHQVLGDVEAGKDAALLRAQGNAAARDQVRAHANRLGALKLHRALALTHQADDAFHRGGFAGAVAAQQGYDLALVHVEIDAMQDMAFAVPCVKAPYLEHRFIRHRWFPDRRRSLRDWPTRWRSRPLPALARGSTR